MKYSVHAVGCLDTWEAFPEKTKKIPKTWKSQNKTADSYEALWQSNNKSRKNV